MEDSLFPLGLIDTKALTKDDLNKRLKVPKHLQAVIVTKVGTRYPRVIIVNEKRGVKVVVKVWRYRRNHGQMFFFKEPWQKVVRGMDLEEGQLIDFYASNMENTFFIQEAGN